MANLRAVVNALKKERQRTTKQIERIDAALAALGSLSRRGNRGKRRPLSAAARRKIAAAQRARWAKIKAKKAA